MKKTFLLICALALFFCFTPRANAQIEEGTWNLSVMGGGIFPSKLHIDNGPIFGLGLGYNFTENWGLEAFAHFAPRLNDDDITPSGDNDIFIGRLNALYHFNTNSGFVPYLTFGIGGLKDDREVHDDYSSFSANAGLGFKYFFNDTIALRLEATDVYGFKRQQNERFNAPIVTAGLTFQFGQPKAACLDSDGDKVCDVDDKCPGTPLGYRVDEVGCPITVAISLDVKFDFDKSVVKPNYRSEVEKAAVFLNNHPGSTAVVEGYTDSKGSDEYNQKLSERRATAVRDYLVSEFNVAPSRVSAVGYGEANPIATNDTEEGRAQNRRVVGVFTGTDVDQ